MTVPTAMGSANAINFQPTGGGKAAITGDFVITGDEVNPMIKALRANGIEVTALHSHMLTEQPRVFFMHFWANDDAPEAGQGDPRGAGQDGRGEELIAHQVGAPEKSVLRLASGVSGGAHGVHRAHADAHATAVRDDADDCAPGRHRHVHMVVMTIVMAVRMFRPITSCPCSWPCDSAKCSTTPANISAAPTAISQLVDWSPNATANAAP